MPADDPVARLKKQLAAELKPLLDAGARRTSRRYCEPISRMRARLVDAPQDGGGPA